MPETIGDYQFSKRDLIGHGAFAIVFLGHSKSNPDQQVAIKQITKKHLAKSQNLLEKEIRILKELTKLKHDNLVALFDCKESQNNVYLVMEYCNGGDLADYLHVKQTLSEDTIAIFFRQIAAALRACHEQNVVHRDMKPQNILLSHPDKSNPRVQDVILKIADFGFARFLSDGVMAGTLCGSPMYMAPEVIRSLQYDGKADLWSTGTIMYQCLTGKAPFQAQTPQALKQFYERNTTLSPAIPPTTSRELADLITRTLKRNPKERIEYDEFFNHPFLRKSQPVNIALGRTQASGLSIISSSPLREGILSQGHDFDLTTPRYVARSIDPIPEQEFDTFSNPILSSESKSTEPRSPSPVNQNSPTRNKLSSPVKRSPNASIPMAMKTHELATLPEQATTGNYTAFNQLARDKRLPSNEISNAKEFSPSSRPDPTTLAAIENTTPVKTARTASVSQAIPVPSQVQNYEKMQETRDRTKSFGGTSNTSPYGSPYDDRRVSIERLRQAGIASSSSDLANSISPPTIRFIADNAALMVSNSFNNASGRRRTVTTPPPGSSLPSQQFTSHSSFDLHNKSKLTLATSPLDFQSKLTEIDDTQNLFFDQENTIDYFTKNTDHSLASTTTKTTSHAGTMRQRVSSLFGDSQPEDRYYEPQQITDDTLMDSEHHDTLGKLQFILQLVEYITTLASARTSLLTEPFSLNKNPPLSRPKMDRLSHADHLYKRAEQLTLYVKAMHFLSSAMCLARDTLKSGKLNPSNTVRMAMSDLNNKYKQCLLMCKQLSAQEERSTDDEMKRVPFTADKLLYHHAIELCLNAASSEFFGKANQCVEPYTQAQILFHSLSQQASSESDRLILRHYREAVERRLHCLQNQGLVTVNESTAAAHVAS